ncbi:pyridoxal-phosphate dependent enzyme [Pseudahrensia aquimaris]|uniref:Pyridoxal-phosphate dependent enzyme n=1 Tax=Pseudahrensia aquimaris TaxID=744461 RepID=A0ABW3FDT0_9HYPH
MPATSSVKILKNPLRHVGLPSIAGLARGDVETDAAAARALYAHCPAAAATPLIQADGLAAELGVAHLALKDERERMGLGSFKALGAAYAIAKQAAAKADAADPIAMAKALEGETFVCASAGNHGLSLAAGAKLFGARAVVYLAETVPEDFANRLRAKGADVVIEGADYQASMEASKKAAAENGWLLLSDGSWLGYSDPARDVMEGYLIMGHEVAEQISTPPTHIFLQAGVGGLAAACAAAARSHWGDDVVLIVVEPEAAPALIESIKAGTSVDTSGPVSSMGRLDCKTPSHLALKYLAKEADFFTTISDADVATSLALFAEHGITTSPSGGAGLAMLHQANKSAFGIEGTSRVLCYISEGA